MLLGCHWGDLGCYWDAQGEVCRFSGAVIPPASIWFPEETVERLWRDVLRTGTLWNSRSVCPSSGTIPVTDEQLFVSRVG